MTKRELEKEEECDLVYLGTKKAKFTISPFQDAQPVDVFTTLFKFLSTKTIIIIRRVNKSWKNLIDSKNLHMDITLYRESMEKFSLTYTMELLEFANCKKLVIPNEMLIGSESDIERASHLDYMMMRFPDSVKGYIAARKLEVSQGLTSTSINWLLADDLRQLIICDKIGVIDVDNTVEGTKEAEAFKLLIKSIDFKSLDTSYFHNVCKNFKYSYYEGDSIIRELLIVYEFGREIIQSFIVMQKLFGLGEGAAMLTEMLQVIIDRKEYPFFDSIKNENLAHLYALCLQKERGLFGPEIKKLMEKIDLITGNTFNNTRYVKKRKH
jgi:hypothetical protein